MKIYFDDRTCGSGKTFGEMNYVVNNRGRYLLAVDQRRSMREREYDIRQLADRAGRKISIVLIESGRKGEEQRLGLTTTITSTSVRATVAAVPVVHDVSHVVVIISHEALKLADLSKYVGWHLVVDETPSILDQQSLQTTLTRDLFKRHYSLAPSGRRSEIVAKGRVSAADIQTDTLLRPVAVMHQRVLSDRTMVLTDLTCWEELDSDKNWTWASIWSPEQLEVFDSVLILANAFKRSLTYAVLKRLWPEIEWVPHQRLKLRHYQQRTMSIRYFAERHRASRSLFSSEVGSDRIESVAQWIAANVQKAGHIWTCNEPDQAALQRHLQGHTRLSPRMAGSNGYADATTVSAIYTAKASPVERALFEDLGIDPHTATETREYETLFQFACRCAVRDPANNAHLTVHVYDRAQALYLHELFLATGYVDPTLELVDLGFAHTPPLLGQKPGPKPKVRSTEEREQKKRRDRELSRERQRRRRSRSNSDSSKRS